MKFLNLIRKRNLDANGILFIYCRFAYIRQEDLFFSQLTVRETLSLAAELQLPEIASVEDRDEYVNNLLFKLGLVRLGLGSFPIG